MKCCMFKKTVEVIFYSFLMYRGDGGKRYLKSVVITDACGLAKFVLL